MLYAWFSITEVAKDFATESPTPLVVIYLLMNPIVQKLQIL